MKFIILCALVISFDDTHGSPSKHRFARRLGFVLGENDLEVFVRHFWCPQCGPVFVQAHSTRNVGPTQECEDSVFRIWDQYLSSRSLVAIDGSLAEWRLEHLVPEDMTGFCRRAELTFLRIVDSCKIIRTTPLSRRLSQLQRILKDNCPANWTDIRTRLNFKND